MSAAEGQNRSVFGAEVEREIVRRTCPHLRNIVLSCSQDSDMLWEELFTATCSDDRSMLLPETWKAVDTRNLRAGPDQLH